MAKLEFNSPLVLRRHFVRSVAQDPLAHNLSTKLCTVEPATLFFKTKTETKTHTHIHKNKNMLNLLFTGVSMKPAHGVHGQLRALGLEMIVKFFFSSYCLWICRYFVGAVNQKQKQKLDTSELKKNKFEQWEMRGLHATLLMIVAMHSISVTIESKSVIFVLLQKYTGVCCRTILVCSTIDMQCRLII